MDKKQIGQIIAGAGMAWGAGSLANDVRGDIAEGNASVNVLVRIVMAVILASTWSYCITHNNELPFVGDIILWGILAAVWFYLFVYIACLVLCMNVALLLLDMVLVFFGDSDFDNFLQVVGWIPGMFWPGVFPPMPSG